MIESLKTLWTWVYVVGFAGFAIVALVIIPLGLRDLMRLLQDLRQGDEE